MPRGRPKGSRNKPKPREPKKLESVEARIVRLTGSRYRVIAKIADTEALAAEYIAVKPDAWKVGMKILVESRKVNGCNWVCISKPGKVK